MGLGNSKFMGRTTPRMIWSRRRLSLRLNHGTIIFWARDSSYIRITSHSSIASRKRMSMLSVEFGSRDYVFGLWVDSRDEVVIQ